MKQMMYCKFCKKKHTRLATKNRCHNCWRAMWVWRNENYNRGDAAIIAAANECRNFGSV